MDPYIFGIIMILVTLSIGVFLVFRIYQRRTREPKIDTSKVTGQLGLELPDGVNLEDAIGRLK